jgi:hypothetical protein
MGSQVDVQRGRFGDMWNSDPDYEEEPSSGDLRGANHFGNVKKKGGNLHIFQLAIVDLADVADHMQFHLDDRNYERIHREWDDLDQWKLTAGVVGVEDEGRDNGYPSCRKRWQLDYTLLLTDCERLMEAEVVEDRRCDEKKRCYAELESCVVGQHPYW